MDVRKTEEVTFLFPKGKVLSVNKEELLGNEVLCAMVTGHFKEGTAQAIEIPSFRKKIFRILLSLIRGDSSRAARLSKWRNEKSVLEVSELLMAMDYYHVTFYSR